MKILFIIGTLNAGGAEKVMTMLSNYMSQKEHTVSLLTFSDKKPFFELDNFITRYVAKEYPSNSLRKRLYNIKEHVKDIKKTINSVNPNIVISFMTELNVLAIIASKLARKPIIVSEHTSFLKVKKRFWKYLRQMVYPFSNGLVLLTKEDQPYYSFVKEKYVIPNPLLLTHSYKEIEREKIILGVGRLRHVKGFDRLINAFSMLQNAKDWKLVLVGEGSERIKLEEQIAELNLAENILLVGQQKDMELFYKKASIFVLSSREEGFPGVLCEAMGYGCAVVSFDCKTGPKEIINNDYDGKLVEADNVKELSKNIDYFINNPKQRDLFGLNAQKIETKLNLETIYQQWMDVIHTIKVK